jgi:hypothetical protein
MDVCREWRALIKEIIKEQLASGKLSRHTTIVFKHPEFSLLNHSCVIKSGYSQYNINFHDKKIKGMITMIPGRSCYDIGKMRIRVYESPISTHTKYNFAIPIVNIAEWLNEECHDGVITAWQRYYAYQGKCDNFQNVVGTIVGSWCMMWSTDAQYPKLLYYDHLRFGVFKRIHDNGYPHYSDIINRKLSRIFRTCELLHKMRGGMLV